MKAVRARPEIISFLLVTESYLPEKVPKGTLECIQNPRYFQKVIYVTNKVVLLKLPRHNTASSDRNLRGLNEF